MGQCSSTSKVPKLAAIDGTGSGSESSSSQTEVFTTPTPMKRKASRRGSFFQDSASTPVGEHSSELLESIKKRIPTKDDHDDDSDSEDTAVAVIPSPRKLLKSPQSPKQLSPKSPQKSICLEPRTQHVRTKKMRERSLPALLEKERTPLDAEVSSVCKRLNNSISSVPQLPPLDESEDDTVGSVSKRLGSSFYVDDREEAQDQLPDLPSTHSFRFPPHPTTIKGGGGRASLQVSDLEKADLRKESSSSWYQLSCTSRTGSTYSSYHSFGQSNLSELEVTLMASQQSLGARFGFLDRMHMSRTEKNALSGLHGFCFTDSEEEDDDDENDEEEEQGKEAAAAEADDLIL